MEVFLVFPNLLFQHLFLKSFLDIQDDFVQIEWFGDIVVGT